MLQRAIYIVAASSLLFFPSSLPGAGDHHEHSHGSSAGVGASAEPYEPAEPGEYIKFKTPAGYTSVVGRANPLEELRPEVVKDPDGVRVKVFKLTVEDVGFEIYPGKTVQGWGFNGKVPGPTIRVKEGERVRVVLTNKTKDKHTIHLHGQKKPLGMDGVPFISQSPVGEGESFAYEFVARNPGTHWYHCHVDSGHHVDMGMYGALIVEPEKESLRYDREYILILDEWPTGHVHIHETPMAGHDEHGVVTEHPGEPRHEHEEEAPPGRDWYPEIYPPYNPVYDTFVINGRAFPFTSPLDVRQGETVRIRLINAGYASHFIHTHSHKFSVVARDGNSVPNPQVMDTVDIGPGQRVDIMLAADNPGVWPVHCHTLTHVANDKVYPGGMLTFLRYVE